jgi:short subunit dehydrogenase-like uncharacterized protein
VIRARQPRKDFCRQVLVRLGVRGFGSEVAELADQLGLSHGGFAVGEPTGLAHALKGVDLLLSAEGTFLHTARPLAEACIAAGVHYLDISNELQVFSVLYAMDERAKRVGSCSWLERINGDCVT